MKSLGESFGFEILLTVLLPGLAVFIGLLAVEPDLQQSMRSSFPAVVELLSGKTESTDTDAPQADASAAKTKTAATAESRPAKSEREWLHIFAVMAVVSLLGASVAALNGFFETHWYDRITPLLLGIDADTFLTHWEEYLYRLGKESNNYVDRIVAWFLFESRMAVAIAVVIAFGLFAGEIWSGLVIWLGLAFIAFAIFAMMHHYELAKHRMTRYEDWRALRLAEVAVARRQAADAASARGVAARLDEIEQKVRRLRRKVRRPPQPIGPHW
jgi:hypothetical protein